MRKILKVLTFNLLNQKQLLLELRVHIEKLIKISFHILNKKKEQGNCSYQKKNSHTVDQTDQVHL